MRKIVTIVVGIIILLALFVSSLYFLFPIKYEEEILKYADEYNIDPHLIFSIINIESKFDKDAKSVKDARGLMQIREITGKWASDNIELLELAPEDYYDPDNNIKVGCWYLSRLQVQYGGNLTNMIAAYNAGIGNVNKWLEEGLDIENGEIPFKETREYVKKVKNNMKIYNLLY